MSSWSRPLEGSLDIVESSARATISIMTIRPDPTQHLSDLAWLRRVRDRIDREYEQPLDVEALARGAHMSAGHLSREFKLAYGESPYSYLMTRRIERAMALLRRGDQSAPRSLRGRLLVVGNVQHAFHRAGRRAAERLPARRCPVTAGMPACIAKQVTRPIRNREAPVAEAQPA